MRSASLLIALSGVVCMNDVASCLYHANTMSKSPSSSGDTGDDFDEDYDENNNFHRRYMESRRYRMNDNPKTPVYQGVQGYDGNKLLSNDEKIFTITEEMKNKNESLNKRSHHQPFHNSNSPHTALHFQRSSQTQSRDLRRIIQELEESDYGNYGSWGNFRERTRPPPSQSVPMSYEEYEVPPPPFNTHQPPMINHNSIRYDHSTANEMMVSSIPQPQLDYQSLSRSWRQFLQEEREAEEFRKKEKLKEVATTSSLRLTGLSLSSSSKLIFFGLFNVFAAYAAVPVGGLSIAAANEVDKQSIIYIIGSNIFE